jgi:hypothetical protein
LSGGVVVHQMWGGAGELRHHPADAARLHVVDRRGRNMIKERRIHALVQPEDEVPGERAGAQH